MEFEADRVQDEVSQGVVLSCSFQEVGERYQVSFNVVLNVCWVSQLVAERQIVHSNA